MVPEVLPVLGQTLARYDETGLGWFDGMDFAGFIVCDYSGKLAGTDFVVRFSGNVLPGQTVG